MQFRRFGLVLMAMVLVVASLAGCVAGADTNWPDREVSVDLDTALAAQEMGMGGLMLGSASFTEAEFSSLLTYLVRQNAGDLLPVESVNTLFEPDNQIFIEVIPGEGAMLAGPVRLSGTIDVVDNILAVDVTNASVAGVGVAGSLLDVVSAAVNRALNDPSLGVAVSVTTGEGTIDVGLQ